MTVRPVSLLGERRRARADALPWAQVLDNKPSALFWTTLAQAFETQAKESARCASMLHTLDDALEDCC